MSVASWIFGHVLVLVTQPGGRAVEAPIEVGDPRDPEGPLVAEPRASEPEAAVPEPVPAPEPAPASLDRLAPARRDTLLWNNYVGLGAGGRWGRREVEPTDVPEDRSGVETTATGVGGIQGRLAGYASSRPAFGGGLRFITPELFASLEVGGTRRTVAGTLVPRPGGATFGAQGVVRIGLGRSLASRVSPYGKLQLDQRFAVHYRDSAEGNHYVAALRGSAGILGRTHSETVVVLAGGAIDGVAGAQAIGRGSAVLQAMAGAELAIYAHPVRHLMLAWVGEARTTLAGERLGGRRTEGRATFDLMIGGPSERPRIKSVSLFATFTATEIRVPGERRLGFAGLLGVGAQI